MQEKEFCKILGFIPKENTEGVFEKKYGNYSIEVNFKEKEINYGELIKSESKTTQNFFQKENWVVLECVDRLLTKGYKPQNIILEKTWATGHGTSGRLDILVTRDDGSSYLMIECKTWGAEFDKEFKKIEKTGGQLFTYFQQDKNADILMLYCSKLSGGDVNFNNIIIKIEEDHRQTGNVKDFHDRWNKLPKTNGVFESWTNPYEYQSKALTKKDLKVLKQEDSSFIFNRFLEILRHNVVSDKPNAFNKIFTLFLCKIVDENRNEDEQLDFQWIEGEDDNIKFQKRLTDLYRRGMKELLEKEVTDVSDSEFDKRFGQVELQYREEIKDILTEIRLKKNNEFAVKEVYDDESFNENAKVVKEIVELLQVYQLRYNYRQQFLSDFFELLLTTGLKQESGQFFTPVPVARFILKSIPVCDIAEKKLGIGNKSDLLPHIIDYAAGSGHFVTESMEDIQKYIDVADEKKYAPATQRALRKWKDDQFDWAEDYIYAIEKDYRLVKTAKVSCYLHGDGLAKVIHGDGIGDFSTAKEYKDLLTIVDKTYLQDNKQFDIVVSNPPYSVSAFKGTMMEKERAEKAFDLYSRLTDQSSEIECLFVERTKQLLKDGGIAGIILPSSILSNTGIYTQTREIVLKYFEIIAIAEFGNNTFMATGTNTVVLFLRRRNNADWQNIHALVNNFASSFKDVTINGIEKPVSKYVSHVWEGISFEDYLSVIKKSPSEKIREHEIYKEYDKKIKAKNEQGKVNSIVERELEKLFYFILAYSQKIVLVKSGEKNAEKQFLGYEFRTRRGSEGIHPMQRSKSIDECTSLYDADSFENPEKASTYIYKNFQGESDFEIHESLKNNVSQLDLVDALSFDRADFDKNISLNSKKKVKIESKWDQVKIENLSELIKRGKSPKYGKSNVQIIKSGQARGYYNFDFSERFFVSNNFTLDERKLQKGDLLVNSSGVGTAGRVTCFDLDGDFVVDSHITIVRLNKELVLPRFVLNIFGVIGFKNLEKLALGQSGQVEMSIDTISNIKIPLPPKSIQEKIVYEIELLEKQEQKAVGEIERKKNEIFKFYKNTNGNQKRLNEICELKAGKFVKADVIFDAPEEGLYPCYGGNGLRGYTKTFTNEGAFSLVGRQGALCGNVHFVSGKFHATEHALVVYPKNDVNSKWLHYKLVEMKLNQYSTGTAQPGLSVMNLNPIEISVPSIKEQEKIVTQIEKIEAKIAKLEKEIAEIPKKKEQILKKYL